MLVILENVYFILKYVSPSQWAAVYYSPNIDLHPSVGGATPKHEQWTLTITMCYQTSFQKFLLWRKSHNINTAPLRPGADNYMQYTGDGFYKWFWLDRITLSRLLIGSLSGTEITFDFFPIENYCSEKLVVALLQLWLIVYYPRQINIVTA